MNVNHGLSKCKPWLEEQQLDQDPQVPGNVKTPHADRKRRRKMPDSSVQDPDYESQILHVPGEN
jgi:hypothetical protein